MKRGVPLFLILSWIFVTMGWWAVAFYPIQASNEWLTLLQSVCFGITHQNGLPENYGWMTLVGSPLLFLGAIISVWYQELKHIMNSFFKARFGKIFITSIFLSVTAEALWVYNRVQKAQQSVWKISEVDLTHLPEEYPLTQTVAPAIHLIDQNQKNVVLDQLRGENIFLTFAFAHCDSVCPLIVKNVLEAFHQLKEKAPRILIITLDPWRDRPSTLSDLASNWNLPNSKAHVLSGEVTLVNSVLEAYKVPHERDMKTGDISHPPLVYVIDKKGYIRFSFNNPQPLWLVEAIDKISNL